MTDIRPHSDADPRDVEVLLDRAFGPGRKQKTAYRLRDGVASVAELGFVALEDGRLRGSIQFWPVQIRSRDDKIVEALLLGPLAVDPDCAAQGFGLALMQHGLAEAERLGHRIVILVGDEPYYARVGFHRRGAEGLSMPGPVDPTRLLVLELQPGAADGLAGAIESCSKTVSYDAEPAKTKRIKN